MDTSLGRRPIVPSIRLRLAMFDLLLTGGSFMIWLFVGGVDMRVHAAAVAVRIIVFHANLWRLLGPVRSWRALGGEADDRSLLAADWALQRLSQRLVVGYALGWVGVQAFDLAVNVFAPPSALVVANAELLVFSLISSAAILVVASLMGAVAPYMAHEHTAEVSRELFERRLSPPRPRLSFDMQMRRLFSMFCFGILLGLLAAGRVRSQGSGGDLSDPRSSRGPARTDHGARATDEGVRARGRWGEQVDADRDEPDC